MSSSHSRRSAHSGGLLVLARAVPAMAAALFLALAVATSPTSAAPASQEVMSPSGLRDTLNFLGQEHVYLTTAALGDLLRGDTVAYGAALTRLNDNSGRMAETIGAIYGPEAETSFRRIWQARSDGFLDYALGASAKDDGLKAPALQALNANRMEIGEFLAAYNPNLHPLEVAASLREGVDEMTGAIDAMADQEWGRLFSLTHLAAHQSAEFTDPVADAIAVQFAEQMNGGVTGPAAEMSAAFTRLIQEHVFLTSMATGALAIGNRDKAQAGLATAQNNGREISTLVGEMYNDETETTFEALWIRQVDAYGNYARAHIDGDTVAMDAEQAALASWVTETGGILTAANPFFTQASVESVLSNHVSLTLRSIDAQVARDWQAAYTGLQLGAHESLDLANVVAGGITDAFGEQSGAQVLPLEVVPDDQR